MKKIFNILMIAAVALGAVACDNAIDDNLTPEQNGESLSIEVEISDATKVALGDFVEDKGYKLDFEDGDQLLVTTAWGGDTANAENNFWLRLRGVVTPRMPRTTFGLPIRAKQDSLLVQLRV